MYHADDVPIFVGHLYRPLEDVVVEVEAWPRNRLGGVLQAERIGPAHIDDIAEIGQRLDGDGASERNRPPGT